MSVIADGLLKVVVGGSLDHLAGHVFTELLHLGLDT
jgi:peptide deformylase